MGLKKRNPSRDPLTPGFPSTGKLSAAEIAFIEKHHNAPTVLGTELGAGYLVEAMPRSGTVVQCRSCLELWKFPHAAAESTEKAAEIRAHDCYSSRTA